MKTKEEILKALKKEMIHKVRCHNCLVSKFYPTSVGKKIYPTSVGKKIYPNFDSRVICFYRFCDILEYYFGIDTEEIQKIYLKYGRCTDFLYSCFKARKDFWQEMYKLCLKRTNFNKI